MKTKDLENLSDEILLARIQNGDDDALVALIKKCERLLKTIAFGCVLSVKKGSAISTISD